MDYEVKDGGSDEYIEPSLYFTKQIREYSDILEQIGINPDTLGCVMLNVEPINLWNHDLVEKLLDKNDLYVSENPERFWIDGDVTDKGHVTLLYGLITPAYEQVEVVDAILEKWEQPKVIRSHAIVAFPSPYQDENYCAIVAKIDEPLLRDAHARLSYLPHVNTYAKYEPHVTLFYVKANVADYWVDVLRRFPIEFNVQERAIDYGSKD